MWEVIKKYYPIVFICALGAFVVLNLVIYFAGVLIYFDFVEFCNDNEGFFSALLGFLAILISVFTYYNQKKEQTKNAQENAKLQRELEEKNANLQRELTEQNNKFQADLQLRQIKLDSYKIRLECWVALSKIENFFESEKKRYLLHKERKGFAYTAEYKELIVFMRKLLDFSSVFTQIKFMISKENGLLLEDVREFLYIIYSPHRLWGNEKIVIDDMLDVIQKAIPVVEILRKEIERDLFIADIHKF